MAPPSRSKRPSAPKDFSLRIESFSKLAKACSANEKYEPIAFPAEGYNWKLQLYPNGKIKGNSVAYISLYLAIASFPSNQNVYAEFKFFIFDQINNDYAVINDGEVKCFRTMKKELGYDQLIEFDVFTDPANGYIVNDCCEIGVEITVVPNYTTKGQQTIQFITPSPSDPPFQWSIEDFSPRGKAYYAGSTVTFNKREWKLKVYPSGKGTETRKSLSLFVELVDAEKIPPGRQVWAEFKLRVVNRLRKGDKEHTVRNWFSVSSPDEKGVLAFMPLRDLADDDAGFILDDNKLILQLEFIDVSATNVSP